MSSILIAGAIALAGCGDSPKLKNSSEGNGPKLVSSTPKAEGRLAAHRRRVMLQFDDVLDTGAQVLVQFHGADVIAGEPELTRDRRGLVAVIDAEDRGTYEVTWRACSARNKTACSKGTFGFHAPGT